MAEDYSLPSYPESTTDIKKITMNEENKIREKCKHVHPDGRRCKVWPLKNDAYCLFHSTTDYAKRVRTNTGRDTRFRFGKMKIRDQADLQGFVEKYLERIANVGISITPQMTKATSDMIAQYISLKQLSI